LDSGLPAWRADSAPLEACRVGHVCVAGRRAKVLGECVRRAATKMRQERGMQHAFGACHCNEWILRESVLPSLRVRDNIMTPHSAAQRVASGVQWQAAQHVRLPRWAYSGLGRQSGSVGSADWCRLRAEELGRPQTRQAKATPGMCCLSSPLASLHAGKRAAGLRARATRCPSAPLPDDAEGPRLCRLWQRRGRTSERLARRMARLCCLPRGAAAGGAPVTGLPPPLPLRPHMAVQHAYGPGVSAHRSTSACRGQEIRLAGRPGAARAVSAL
jgi:hypothetical protein